MNTPSSTRRKQRYNPDMDIWDWVMAGAMVILAGAIFYFIYPPYGAILGAGMGILLTWRAKKNRDKARRQD